MAANLTEMERELLNLDILLFFEYKYRIPKDPLFDNEAYYPIYYDNSRYVNVYGGRGSGKSAEVIGKMPIVLISCMEFCRVLMVRQVFDSMKVSCFQEIMDYIDKWQLWEEFHVTRSPMKITHKESNNCIMFAGMDKPSSIKSIKDITHVFFEEAFQITDEEGVDVIDKSIRTPKVDNHKLFFVFNPDNEKHWIYDKFHAGHDYNAYYRDNSLLLHTTYRDNKFVPDSFIQLIEKDRQANPNRYKVDGLGEWGTLKMEGLFYHAFESGSNVVFGLKKAMYEPTKQLHIAFDFNVYPYISLTVHQIHYDNKSDVLQVCQIDEICLTENNVRGKVEETLKEFLNRYRGHIGTVLVYGDRSGHSNKTNGVTDYATVFAMLKKTTKAEFIKRKDTSGQMVEINPYPLYEQLNCRFQVIDNTNKGANPMLIGRKIMFNRIFAGQFSVLQVGRQYGTSNAAGQNRPLSVQYGGKQVVFLIDEGCRYSVKDYQEVKEDIGQGGKSSRPIEITHTSDANDYFFTGVFDAEYRQIMVELKHGV